MSFITVQEVITGLGLSTSTAFIGIKYRPLLQRPSVWTSVLFTISAYVREIWASGFRKPHSWSDDVGYSGMSLLLSVIGLVATVVWARQSGDRSAKIMLCVSGWITFMWFMSAGLTD